MILDESGKAQVGSNEFVISSFFGNGSILHLCEAHQRMITSCVTTYKQHSVGISHEWQVISDQHNGFLSQFLSNAVSEYVL